MKMEKDLILLTWPDYINPLTIEQFQAAFDVKVKLEIVPSAVELIDRLREAGGSPDVLCPPDYAVRELNGEQRLRPLDHNLLPNMRHLEPRFRSGRAHDPESRVSLVKDWGTTGFMYRADRVTAAPRSWRDFWNLAEKYSGQVTVLDSPGEVIGAALKLRGHSFNLADSDVLHQAQIDLLTLKPHLYAFETDYQPLFITDKVWLALGWNGDAGSLKQAGV